MFKKVLSLLLVAAMAVSLCACTGGSTSSSSATSTESTTESKTESTTESKTDSATSDTTTTGDQTLTVWCWDPAFNIFSMQEAEKIYQKDHPDFKLNIVETPWDDIQTKLITAASANDLSTLPDIFLCQNNAYQKNVINYPTIFTDLTSSGIDFSQFSASSVAYSTYDGKNWGVPFDNGAAVFALRTDILEEAGFTIKDFTDVTWDDVIAKGKVVKEKTGKPLFSFQAGGSDLIIMMLKTCGSSLFNADGTVNMVDNAVLKDALTTYKALVDAGVLVEYNSWDEYVASFVNGDVAGTLNGCWILGSVQTATDQSGKWGVTDIPKFADNADSVNYSENGGSSWAVCSNTKKADLAIDFLNSTFAGSTEFYDNILQKAGALANWAPAGESSKYAEPLEFFGGQAVYSDIVKFAKNVKPFNTGVYYYEAATAIGTAVTNVVNGTAIDDAIKAAQDETEFNMQ